MKKYIFLIIAVFVTQNFFSQKIKFESLKEIELNKYKRIVDQSLKYNDATTAINGLHNIIAIEGDLSVYKDSLALVYFNLGNYTSSHLLVQELLKQKSGNVQLLEINAISLQALGRTKEAIDAYELLFSKTNNMFHAYNLANLQFNLKRLEESQISIDRALNCEELNNVYLQFPIDKDYVQNIPLKAAVYNLRGLIKYEVKDINNSKLSFEEALKIMPDFKVANQNLKSIEVLK